MKTSEFKKIIKALVNLASKHRMYNYAFEEQIVITGIDGEIHFLATNGEVTARAKVQGQHDEGMYKTHFYNLELALKQMQGKGELKLKLAKPYLFINGFQIPLEDIDSGFDETLNCFTVERDLLLSIDSVELQKIFQSAHKILSSVKNEINAIPFALQIKASPNSEIILVVFTRHAIQKYRTGYISPKEINTHIPQNLLTAGKNFLKFIKEPVSVYERENEIVLRSETLCLKEDKHVKIQTYDYEKFYKECAESEILATIKVNKKMFIDILKQAKKMDPSSYLRFKPEKGFFIESYGDIFEVERLNKHLNFNVNPFEFIIPADSQIATIEAQHEDELKIEVCNDLLVRINENTIGYFINPNKDK